MLKLCIITLIKDEQQYLKDWINYHIQLVDHIFILEDFNSSSHKKITDLYNDKITLLSSNEFYDEMPTKKPSQSKLQSKLLLYVKRLNIYDWCFVIDADEFITADDTLNNKLSLYEQYDDLILYWQNYNANGLIYMPDYTNKTVIDYYTQICGYTCYDRGLCAIMKKAVHLSKVNEKDYSGFYIYNNHGPNSRNFIKTDLSKKLGVVCLDCIYLRHYITKSFEEFYNKLYKRGMFYKEHRTIDDFFELNPKMKENKDELIKLMENKN